MEWRPPEQPGKLELVPKMEPRAAANNGTLEKEHEVEYFDIEPFRTELVKLFFPKDMLGHHGVQIENSKIRNESGQTVVEVIFNWGTIFNIGRKGKLEVILVNDAHTQKIRPRIKTFKANIDIKEAVRPELTIFADKIKIFLGDELHKRIKSVEVENGKLKITFLAVKPGALENGNGGKTIVGDVLAATPVRFGVEDGIVRSHKEIVQEKQAVAERENAEQQKIKEAEAEREERKKIFESIPEVNGLIEKFTKELNTPNAKQAALELRQLQDPDLIEEYFRIRAKRKDPAIVAVYRRIVEINKEKSNGTQSSTNKNR